jgi:hypothetical protein
MQITLRTHTPRSITDEQRYLGFIREDDPVKLLLQPRRNKIVLFRLSIID